MRLAVIQSPAELPGGTARFDWLRGCLPTVAARGADLVLLPELFACGYNIGDAVAGRAEPVNGPGFDTLAVLAKEFNLALHAGFAERAEGRIYNAALCVAPDGSLLCHQRKLAIPPGFERGHFTPGQGCRMFDWCGLKIATLICYDAEFPETVRHVARLGAQLVLVPTALGARWGWVAHSMIPTRAYENGVFLAYANSAGTENGMAFLGASVIANPDGTEAARAGANAEVIYADLTAAQVTAAQDRLPYLTDRTALHLE